MRLWGHVTSGQAKPLEYAESAAQVALALSAAKLLPKMASFLEHSGSTIEEASATKTVASINVGDQGAEIGTIVNGNGLTPSLRFLGEPGTGKLFYKLPPEVSSGQIVPTDSLGLMKPHKAPNAVRFVIPGLLRCD